MTYRVYLEDYPSRQDFGMFNVEFILADFCDERLIENFILAELEPSCIPVEPEDPDPVDPDDDPEDPLGPVEPEKPEGPTEDEIVEEQ